jgi:hypothetical protein
MEAFEAIHRYCTINLQRNKDNGSIQVQYNSIKFKFIYMLNQLPLRQLEERREATKRTSIEDKTYNMKHKRTLQKENTEGDTIQNIKKRKLQNWRIIRGRLTARRKLINGRNRQGKAL